MDVGRVHRQGRDVMRTWALVPTLCLLVAAPAAQAPPAQAPPAPDPIQRVFSRLYNYDFAGAHVLLDAQRQADPNNPLVYSVRGLAYLFAELDRLKILETEFFLQDDNLADGHGRDLQPDPVLRRKLFESLDQAKAKALARLATHPNDRDALFAMCMVSGVTADYTGFVDRRQWRGLMLSKETTRYAAKLLALQPPLYDAYYNVGALEYVVGSLPFFVRWFVRLDHVQGDKRKGIEAMKLVARHGRYYGPFARVMLAVASLREGKLEDARILLAGVAAEYPANPLARRELRLVTDRINAQARRR